MAEEDPFYLSSSIFDVAKGKDGKSRSSLIEKKIEFLESLAGKVSNRRSRRWLNDHLLIELVPRLNVQEIRGLFAPPPWGDDVPLSPFFLTNVGEWNSLRNADMDKEMSMIISLKSTSAKRKGFSDPDTIAALNAWHRVDWRSRKALRHNYLSNLIEIYEEQLRAFIKDDGEGDVLMIHVEDPYHRLLLHGVCEFYNLLSTTITKSTDEGKSMKVMSIKKKSNYEQTPNIKLVRFLKMIKVGHESMKHDNH